MSANAQKQTLEFAPRFDFLAVTASRPKTAHRVILIATPKMKLSHIKWSDQRFPIRAPHLLAWS